MKKLFSRKLEKVSREIFEEFPKALSALIGKSHGIYALYDENELYYVGKASNLKNRIRQHLKDRHLAQWTHFSLYLTSRTTYIDDIESVLISVSDPKGNRNRPRGRADARLKKELKTFVKKMQTDQVNRIFGSKNRRKNESFGRSILKGYRKTLYKEYKGKDYQAKLLPSGKIKYKNKLYDSPTGAAKAATGRKTINGWKFWYFRNDDGDWKQIHFLR